MGTGCGASVYISTGKLTNFTSTASVFLGKLRNSLLAFFFFFPRKAHLFLKLFFFNPSLVFYLPPSVGIVDSVSFFFFFFWGGLRTTFHM
jgi:hypothetical protein